MIFIDSNVPMYLVGAAHPNKSRARSLLETLIAARERLVSSAEVYQEVLHRYVAIQRHEAIKPAWAALADIVDDVFAVEPQDVERARDLVLNNPDLSARDAIHAAVMQHHEIGQILSFDGGFDGLSGVTRIA